MKTILPLLVLACAGLVAVGCDPAPKDETNAKSMPVADKPAAAMLGTKDAPPKR